MNPGISILIGLAILWAVLLTAALISVIRDERHKRRVRQHGEGIRCCKCGADLRNVRPFRIPQYMFAVFQCPSCNTMAGQKDDPRL